ncbi:MAG: cytochrome c oxidase subunit II [Solirubrobacterales bacterium]
MVQIDWNGPQASAQADDIDTLLDVMIVISAFVFAVVMVMMGYAIWKFRAKPGDESDGKPVHGNAKLELVWTVIPTIIVVFGAVYSWIVLDDIEAKEPDRLQVDVTAQQFAWRFDYPEFDVTSTELHAPVGRQLELTLTSLDVIHAFWVPEWRIKRDIVPVGPSGNDVDNTIVVTPDVEGTYSVVCTELCGTGHSTMRAFTVVESQEEFDAWTAEQKPIPEESQVSTGAAGGDGTPAGEEALESGENGFLGTLE